MNGKIHWDLCLTSKHLLLQSFSVVYADSVCAVVSTNSSLVSLLSLSLKESTSLLNVHTSETPNLDCRGGRPIEL